MVKIRLMKGASYHDGKITATKKKPIVTVEDQKTAAHYVATGFFAVLGSVEPEAEKPDDELDESFFGDDEPEGPTAIETLRAELQEMSVKELRAYASKAGIDLSASKKEDMIEQIVSAQQRADEARAALRE